jgi:hypothetical protein
MRIRIKIQDFDDQKLQFTYPPGLNKGCLLSKLQEKSSSLKRKYLARQYLSFLPFCGSYWPSWFRIRFPNADPDPADQNECNTENFRDAIKDLQTVTGDLFFFTRKQCEEYTTL